MPGWRTLPLTSTTTSGAALPTAVAEPAGVGDAGPAGPGPATGVSAAIRSPSRSTHHAVVASAAATTTTSTASCPGPSATRPASSPPGDQPGRRAACRPGAGITGGTGEGRRSGRDSLRPRPLPDVRVQVERHERRLVALDRPQLDAQLLQPLRHGVGAGGSSRTHAATLGSGGAGANRPGPHLWTAAWISRAQVPRRPRPCPVPRARRAPHRARRSAPATPAPPARSASRPAARPARGWPGARR